MHPVLMTKDEQAITSTTKLWLSLTYHELCEEMRSKSAMEQGKIANVKKELKTRSRREQKSVNTRLQHRVL
jgi:hypothetical protein